MYNILEDGLGFGFLIEIIEPWHSFYRIIRI